MKRPVDRNLPRTAQPRRLRVLFVSHEASRTGAPLLLLSFLRWLRSHTTTDFEVLLLKDGPVRDDFAAIAPTFLADDLSRRNRLVQRVANRLRPKPDGHWIARACKRLVARRYDVVYANSVVCLPWAVAFSGTGPRCACHVHEMTWMIEQSFARPYVETCLAQLDLVIACSAAVASDLRTDFAVTSAVAVAHSFIDPDIVIHESRAALRARLGIADDEVVISGVGTPELRKGVDLLIPLALALRRDHPLMKFRILWLGGSARHEIVTICQRDARKLGLQEQVQFIEHTRHPNDYINASDIFIVPSREEPLSLVALAAACLAKPIVAFEGSGGVNEILSDGAGMTVPYLDVARMASIVHGLSADPDMAMRVGERAREKARALFTSALISPLIHGLIEDLARDDLEACEPNTGLAPGA